jgi:signal transduction histidine kinase
MQQNEPAATPTEFSAHAAAVRDNSTAQAPDPLPDTQADSQSHQDMGQKEQAELHGHLNAILGHDLRNRLQAIFVTSELIARKFNDPVLVGLAGRIKAASMQISSLADDALDLARSRLGGGISIRMDEGANVSEGLQAMLQELRNSHPGRQIIANINVQGPIRCDLARIRQLAFNLVHNALSYGAPEGPVKVSATASGNEFILEVWNDGQPISPASLAGIFEPVSRQSETSNRQSLGLGLYIGAQIVRAHAGRLTARSAQNAGTCFTARFPL